MRTVKTRRLILLSALLVVAALLVNAGSEPDLASPAKKPLQQAFAGFGPWHSAGTFAMDAKVVEALHLDDYLYQSYRGDQGAVNLYIGYYHSAKKVGAAHDPLVCFQGQGWKIGERESGSYALTRHPELKVSYSSMVAERQDEREVIVYWFQANAKAAATTQSQKLAMVLDRMAGRGEDNAFVRLSAPVGSGTPEATRRRIFQFIEEFYPQFLSYVTHS